MTREEKIKFIIDSIWEFEDVYVKETTFAGYSDKELDEEVDWYDYLWTK